MKQLEYLDDAASRLRVDEPQLALAFDGAPPRVDARPIIKWAGGKAQLLPKLQRHLPPMDRFSHYYEPFVGGAAMFFFLQHERSYLSDTNEELVNLYTVVRDRLDELLCALRRHAKLNSEAYFYQVRAQTPASMDDVERAARVIYLNKTCYNGLYRVNGKGEFNVPFGRYKKPTICDADNLEAASLMLRRATLSHGDYTRVLHDVGAGDFVYFDPPYHPLNATSSFTSYTDKNFDANEQARLALEYRRLHAAGAYLMQSNSDTTLIRALYYGFRIETVRANRAINSKGDKRGPISELLIMNYSKSGELLGGQEER